LYHCAFIVSLSEVLFLLFRSVFICSICKFVREFKTERFIGAAAAAVSPLRQKAASARSP